MSDTTIANDVIWDHEQFEVNIGGGNCTFSTYAWINFDVWATVKYKGQQFDINLQNGHGYLGNDFNCPDDKLTLYRDHTPSWVDELWENEDEDFVKFVDDMIDSAEKYLKAFYDEEVLSEIAELYDNLDIDSNDWHNLVYEVSADDVLEKLKELKKEIITE